MPTLIQCIDMIESIRRGQSDACALLDSLRTPTEKKVVDLAQARRGRRSASELLKFLVIEDVDGERE